MPFTIINTQAYFTGEARTHLEQNRCEIRYCALEDLTEDEFCREIRGVHAVIAGGEWYTPKVFAAADKLKIVARTGAGFDHVDIAAASEHGIWVTTTPGATSNAVADFTLGLILCILRNIPAMTQEIKAGEWKQFCGRELASLTVGIVGAGAIGREVIKRVRGFDATILAYDVQPDSTFAENWRVQYVSLDELMAQSDVVSLHTPLNEHTRGLIDERRLKLMKREAYLVNTSRPGVVDKAALVRALEAEEIAGAAIDVHHPHPTSPDDPLVRLDNVIATPWTAYNTEASVAKMCSTAARDVVKVLNGNPPSFPVNAL
jgi:D-3-phosphoglycerate dehydrogenase